jgi:hypothetical protein
MLEAVILNKIVIYKNITVMLLTYDRIRSIRNYASHNYLCMKYNVHILSLIMGINNNNNNNNNNCSDVRIRHTVQRINIRNTTY